MRIPTPAIRFRPFSHLPGTGVLLPGSFLLCQVFPAKIMVTDYSEGVLLAEITLEGFGPLEEFTVIQDLEKGCIQVSGFCKEGFLRYQIIPLESPKSFCLHFLKVPNTHHLYLNGQKMDIHKGVEVYFPASGEQKSMPDRERLFLGCTKSQDWSLVGRRLDIKEILPIWYWLAQSLPKLDSPVILPHLEALSKAVHEQKMHDLFDLFLSLFQVGFKDLLVPRLFDDSYLGFPEVKSLEISPLLLLQRSRDLIRNCFFIELPHHFYILPFTPPQFHSGMLSRIMTSGGHLVTIEWTRQAVRRVWIEGGSDEVVTFAFQKHLKHFRLKSDVVCQLPNFSEVTLQKGKRFLLDHFEK